MIRKASRQNDKCELQTTKSEKNIQAVQNANANTGVSSLFPDFHKKLEKLQRLDKNQ